MDMDAGGRGRFSLRFRLLRRRIAFLEDGPGQAAFGDTLFFDYERRPQYAGSVGTGNQWFEFMRDTFDMLYREGTTQPKMMSVGLHMRLIGHPARAAGLERFIDHVMKHEDVWIARRIDIARHWIKEHPYIQ